MKNKIYFLLAILVLINFNSCSEIVIKLNTENLELVNEIFISGDENTANALTIDAKQGGGMAILSNVDFNSGTIDLELKGENQPGRSFLGIAFNIQNDSTYESVYFRPFNFKSDTKKANAIQYISQPKNTWPFLRQNFPGQFEAEYTNAGSPDDWFEISFVIDQDSVHVYDKNSNTALMRIKRLENQVSDKIALWTGNNSKGEYRNLRVTKK